MVLSKFKVGPVVGNPITYAVPTAGSTWRVCGFGGTGGCCRAMFVDDPADVRPPRIFSRITRAIRARGA